jgi:hypothetical protein
VQFVEMKCCWSLLLVKMISWRSQSRFGQLVLAASESQSVFVFVVYLTA